MDRTFLEPSGNSEQPSMEEQSGPKTLHVIVLHGLGGSSTPMIPLSVWLSDTFRSVHTIDYDPDQSIEEGTKSAHEAIVARIGPPEKAGPICLVGHSMGGLVSNRLHEHGWTIKAAVYIASPLHGARMIRYLEGWVPNFLRKTAYDHLCDKVDEHEPPHPYRTVSVSWPFTTFDGRVFQDEATLNPKFHTHLPWHDHCTVILNPNMWRIVKGLLMDQLVSYIC